MSHIYDALRKSQGDGPDRPSWDSNKDPSSPPAGQAAAPAPQGAQQAKAVVPETRLEGSLLEQPNADFLRELDKLRENIEVMMGGLARRIVGFMGAVPDEGTTTMAVHFACLMARVGAKRVLLVDADMARSRLSLSSVVGERDGLSELLSSGSLLEKVILSTEDPNLHFLPAGRDRIHNVEAVGSGKLRPLFDHLGQLYDIVVVDNAPVLEHPEAPLVGAACDGVVLVVQANRTRREIAQRAIAELNLARCRILGTVLNAYKVSLPRFLRERV